MTAAPRTTAPAGPPAAAATGAGAPSAGAPSAEAQTDAQRSAAIVALGRAVIQKERLALEHVESRLGDSFAAAVMLIARSRGRVIVAGVGKSGLIGRKIAATLTSTGTPATFLHPVDSAHGDLGLVGTDDTAILISKSGESTELMVLLDQVQRLGVRTIAITGAPQSMLGRHCDVVLDAAVDEEACPHDLAPTTSTTAALAVGDALAVALLQEKGFRREDFARLHPGGPLGKKLLTRVADVMVRADLPLLGSAATMREAVVQLAERRGIVMVVADDGRLSGVVTVGDLTRLMQRDTDWQVVTVAAVMTATPRTAREDELGSAAVYRMEHHGIMALPVVDASGRVEGVVHLHDLMQAGSA